MLPYQIEFVLPVKIAEQIMLQSLNMNESRKFGNSG